MRTPVPRTATAENRTGAAQIEVDEAAVAPPNSVVSHLLTDCTRNPAAFFDDRSSTSGALQHLPQQVVADGRGPAPPTAPGTLQRSPVGQSSSKAPPGAGAPQSVVARKGKAAPKQYQVDSDGFLAIAGGDDDGLRVGWAGGGRSYVCVGETGEEGVDFFDAEIGRMTPEAQLLAVREVTVARDAEADPDAPGPVKITPKGPRLAVRFDFGTSSFAEEVLRRSGRWQPIPYAQLDENLQGVLRSIPEAHVVLTDGSFWALMEFTLQGEAKPRLQWAAAKDDDLRAAQRAVSVEEAKLPTAELRDRVDEYATLITAVMAHEGSFGSRSDDTPGHEDPMASIGIFQWGMPKHSMDHAGASMVKFFADLKRYARQPPDGMPASERKLYSDAWTQVSRHGIDVDRGVVTVGGKTATGAQIENLLAGPSGEMARGALRTYQLVAAHDWIEDFEDTLVRPGPSFYRQEWVGSGYSERTAAQATLEHKHGKVTYTYVLDAPADAATVRSVFPTQKNVALAVTLGTNRPHWVEAALWRAVTGKRDVRAEVQAHLAAIAAAAELVEPPPARAKRRAVTPSDIETWGADAEYAALLHEIWPAAGALSSADEEETAKAFKQESLMLYPKAEAVKFERWRRFATVEAAYDQ
jgi:hypothetical protein